MSGESRATSMASGGRFPACMTGKRVQVALPYYYGLVHSIVRRDGEFLTIVTLRAKKIVPPPFVLPPPFVGEAFLLEGEGLRCHCSVDFDSMENMKEEDKERDCVAFRALDCEVRPCSGCGTSELPISSPPFSEASFWVDKPMRFCGLNPQNDTEATIEAIQRRNALSIVRLKFLAAPPPLYMGDLLVLVSLDGQQQWEADVRGDPILLLGGIEQKPMEDSVTVNVRDGHGLAPIGTKLLPRRGNLVEPEENSEIHPANDERRAASQRRANKATVNEPQDKAPKGPELSPPRWISIFIEPVKSSEFRPANNERGAASQRRAKNKDFVNAYEPKIKIGIDGYGSIGGAIATVALESQDVELVAINDPFDKMTCLFRDSGLRDHWLRSVFKVKDSNTLIFGKKEVTIFRIKESNTIPWKSTGAEYIITACYESSDDESSDDAHEDRISQFTHYNDSNLFKHCLSPLAKTLGDRFGTVKGASTTCWPPVVIIFEPRNSNAAKAIGNALPQWKGVHSGLIFQVPAVDASPRDIVIEIYEYKGPEHNVSRRSSSEYGTYRLIPNNLTPSPGFSKLLCWCVETTIQIPRVRYYHVRFK